MKRLIILIALCLNVLPMMAQEATKWRGSRGNDIYAGKNLLKSWPEDGPEMLWHFDELGQGHSSPAFANGKIYLTVMIGRMAKKTWVNKSRLFVRHRNVLMAYNISE